MKATILISVFFLFFFNRAFGQNEIQFEKFVVEVVELYDDFYSVSREKIYTHFNKSSYLPGEAIWFKSYVINPRTQLPSIETRTMRVELYGPDGRLIEQKVLPVTHGVTSNVFSLGQDWESGVYTFRAHTRWMQNFEEEFEELTPIKVLGDFETNSHSGYNGLDLQLLPESGTLLTGITNKLGIKALDKDGRGIHLSGSIVNEQGVAVQNFELNNLGMGSVSLPTQMGEQLRCEVILPNGDRAHYPLPAIEERGVVAQVSQLRDRVYVNIVSNAQTLTKPTHFFVLIHSQGEVQRIALVNLDAEKPSRLVEFDESILRDGVNCLTLFDEELRPVAERLFFVDNGNRRGEVSAKASINQNIVTLKLTASKKLSPARANLSLSVLPGETVSGTFPNSMLSQVLLSGLSGSIENPNYYFEVENTQRELDLDNLMLTQGWRRYAWDRILEGRPLELKYENEEGFSLAGSVNRWTSWLKSKAKVSYVVLNNGVMGFVTPDNLGRFNLEGLEFYDTTNVYLSVANERGRTWNRRISASQYFHPKQDVRLVKAKSISFSMLNDLSAPDMSIYQSDIRIDELRLVGKRIAPPKASDIFMPLDAKSYTITERSLQNYQNIIHLLRQKFLVSNHGTETRPVFRMNRGLNSINAATEPLIIVDDIPLGSHGAETIASMQLSDIESISVNKTSFGMGMRGVDGVIIIRTRTLPLNSIIDGQDRIKVIGYASPAEYYAPRYTVLPPDPAYTKYATIYWEPNILTNSEGEATVRFEVPSRLKNFHLRVEGISNDGIIFHESEILNIE